LLPASFGESLIEIESDGLRNGSVQYQVKVTIGEQIVACLIGGLIGGCLAFLKSRKYVALRLLGGVAGGFILTAIYVFGALPLVNLQFARNTVAVIAVSLVGGYAGTAVLEWGWKKLKV
jgi:hypothetical protein